MGCASTQSIGTDKYYHFAAGAATEVIGHKMDLTPTSAAFAVGFAKELYDYADYGKFDAKDLFATWLGGVVINYIIKVKNDEKSNLLLLTKAIRLYAKSNPNFDSINNSK